jgi:hypothetical protein
MEVKLIKNANPVYFHVNWGSVHPNYLDVEFSSYTFRDNPFLILTGDWEFDTEVIRKWDRKSQGDRK